MVARARTRGELERQIAWRGLSRDELAVVWLYHLIEWGTGRSRQRRAQERLPAAVAAIGEERAAELRRWFVGTNPRRAPEPAEEVQP